MKAKILVVDDDKCFRGVLSKVLRNEGYGVSEAASGKEALAAAAAIKHDMVLLDLSMPDMGGQEVLARMRKAGMNTPVIVISGMDFAEPAIATFRLGALDYVLKPVNFDEVLRRVAAALKAGPPPEGLVEFQELRMSRGKRLAWVNGRQVALTPKEFDLLFFLAAGAENIYGRDALIEAVWNNAESDLRTVDTHICSLRSKLGRVGDYIISEKSVGYGLSRRKRL